MMEGRTLGVNSMGLYEFKYRMASERERYVGEKKVPCAGKRSAHQEFLKAQGPGGRMEVHNSCARTIHLISQ